MRTGWNRAKTALDVLTSLAILVVIGLLIKDRLTDRRQPEGASDMQLPSEPLSVAGAASLGSASAPFVMIEFTDFECPYCAKVSQETIPLLKREYIDTGKLQLVLRHFPLPNHKKAERLAIAAECANRQGRFWEMHDDIFAQTASSDQTVDRAAERLGLTMDQFRACLQSQAGGAITADLELGRRLGVRSTPTFFVGKRVREGTVDVLAAFPGAMPVPQFRIRLDEIMRPSAGASRYVVAYAIAVAMLGLGSLWFVRRRGRSSQVRPLNVSS